MMKYSVLSKSSMNQYDFGYELLSPDFFLRDKIEAWNAMGKGDTSPLSNYFDNIKDTREKCKDTVICYDLSDGIPKFFDGGRITSHIGSVKKTALPGDFAISKLRSYLGEMGIVEERKFPQLFSSEFLIFRAKGEILSPHTLFALCMTDIVQMILDRGQYGTEHPRFYDFLIHELPIPKALISLNSVITQIVKIALIARSDARKMYTEVEELVRLDIGMNNFPAKYNLSYQKSFSETCTAGRIDAEYFDPWNEEIVEFIQRYRGGWGFIRDICYLKNKKFHPNEDENYSYIQLSNIMGGGEILGCVSQLGRNLPSRARRKVDTGDVIVSTVEGSLSRIALISKEHDQHLCSTGFQVIRSNEINPETLFILMGSALGQLQIKRGCSGTNLTSITPDEFSKISLPIVTKEIQGEIQRKVTKYLNLQKVSRCILQCAKEIAEKSIIEGEISATDWLSRGGLLDIPVNKKISRLLTGFANQI